MALSTRRFAAQTVLLAQFICPVTANFATACNPTFAAGYMDPIVTPGQRSGHLHHVSGSLGFNGDTINKKWMLRNASTCDLPGDFSNYWTPALYRTDLGGEQLQQTVHHVYYAYDAMYPIDPHVFGQPLPIVVGNGSPGGLTNAQLEALFPGIVYLVKTGRDSNPIRSERLYNFQAAAEDVIELEINYFFPTCWDGVRAGYDVPFASAVTARDGIGSHFAYPEKDGGPCPETHRRRIPEGKIASRYFLDPPARWSAGEEPPFSFSSGGLNTAHADAVFLWDKDVLGTLISNCPFKEERECIPEQHGLKPKVTLGEKIAVAATYPPIPAMYL